MRGAMALGLRDAGMSPADIDYVNAHGTATDIGDIAESGATRTIFDRPSPSPRAKSFTGHTMGACGAIEAVFCLAMLRDEFLAPTRNLERGRPPLRRPRLHPRAPPRRSRVIMTNNFAFGGVNTSMIFSRVD
jgi:3-oxoacyl-[acyl-carrier-protein] synthase II